MLTAILLSVVSPPAGQVELTPIWSNNIYGGQAVLRTTDQKNIVLTSEKYNRIINPNSGAILETQIREKTVNNRLKNYFEFNNTYSGNSNFGGLAQSQETIPTPDGTTINVFFKGQKISFGGTKDKRLVIWTTGKVDFNETRFLYPQYSEFVGDPDTGLYAFVSPAFEHRPPMAVILRGTEVLLYDDQFVFDIQGDRLLRGRAVQHGVDVTPEGIFVQKAPAFKETLSIKDRYASALWLGENILRIGSNDVTLINMSTGKVIGVIPQLKGQRLVTVGEIIVGYNPTTSTLTAYKVKTT